MSDPLSVLASPSAASVHMGEETYALAAQIVLIVCIQIGSSAWRCRPRKRTHTLHTRLTSL
jgi:hypothetical protein